MKFKERVRTIDAIRFTGSNHKEVYAWVEKVARPVPKMGGNVTFGMKAACVKLDFGNHEVQAHTGDWITCDLRGQFMIMADHFFRQTYEPI